MRRSFIGLGGVVVSLVLSGCASAPASRFPSGAEALRALRAQSSCSRAVSGEARLKIQKGLGGVRGRVLYLAQAPDRIRFDILSPFGATLTSLTSDGARFALFDLREKVFFEGPARTCNVERFTQVPVPPSVLVETLRGRPATLLHAASTSEISWSSPLFGRGHYQIHIHGEHAAEQIVEVGVHPDDLAKPWSSQRLRYLGTEVSQAGERLYTIQLDNYRPVLNKAPRSSSEDIFFGSAVPSGPECQAEIPGSIEFDVATTGYKLTIENEEVWHNPPLAEGAFRLMPVAGVRRQLSQCVDR